jgi:hypothetical protein
VLTPKPDEFVSSLDSSMRLCRQVGQLGRLMAEMRADDIG